MKTLYLDDLENASLRERFENCRIESVHNYLMRNTIYAKAYVLRSYEKGIRVLWKDGRVTDHDIYVVKAKRGSNKAIGALCLIDDWWFAFDDETFKYSIQ